MPGLIFRAPDGRLGEYFTEGWNFSATWPSAPTLAPRQLALLSSGGNALEAVALVTRGRKAATYTWHIAFEPVLPFYAEIELDEFVGELRGAVKHILTSALSGPGTQVPDPVLDEIIHAILTARADAEGPINDIRRLLADAPPLNIRSGDDEPIVLYEGDAIATALEFVELDRGQLKSWSGTPTAPFLEGIEEFRVSEEQLLDNDARHFGDWEVVQDNLVGGLTFSSGKGDYLTVFNVNKEPIERTLGVDLIYYNHNFDSYVLVQYKRMHRTEEDAEFRPDEQLERELARMRAITIGDGAATESSDYRLDHHCCYLKLCWPTTKVFHAGDIAPGMYFPLAYWDLLLRSPVARGPRDGTRLLGNTVGRRLNRSSFVGLVQDAWIGSRGLTSDVIKEAIQSGLDAHRSVLVASGRKHSARPK